MASDRFLVHYYKSKKDYDQGNGIPRKYSIKIQPTKRSGWHEAVITCLDPQEDGSYNGKVPYEGDVNETLVHARAHLDEHHKDLFGVIVAEGIN